MDRKKKYYQDQLDSEKGNIRRKSRLIDNCKSEKIRTEQNLSSNVASRHNAEERLAEVKRIIRLLDRLDGAEISRANKKANDASEAYTNYIKCNPYHSNKISEKYETQTISDDAKTQNAYNLCVSERTRLENAITELDSAIRNAKRQIGDLNSTINSANRSINNSQWNIKRYNRLID